MFRKYQKQIHLWLGLTVGLISSFSGITGALYVWQPEISALFEKDLLKVSDARAIAYKDYLQTARDLESVHLDSLKAIRFPERERQTIRLDFENGDRCYYHPGNGQYLGKNPSTVSFFDTLLRLHRNLCMGTKGKYIIGTSSLLFGFLILGTGLYLWYTIYRKRWRKGFSFKKSANSKTFNFDLHKIVGIYGLLLLFIIAITGGYFTYYTSYKKILNTIPSFEKENSSSMPLPGSGTPFNFDRTVWGLYPHYKIRTIIRYPNDGNPSYRFRFINSITIGPGLRKTTDIFTTHDKLVTEVRSYETSSKTEKITAQMYPLHKGESLGFFNRILVFIGGLLPLVLYITGLRFFLFRKNIIKPNDSIF